MIGIGFRSGRLLVVAPGARVGRVATWVCKCDCGTQKVLRQGNIPQTKSCGCWARERPKTVVPSRKHGNSYKCEFNIWRGMIARCFKKSTPSWEDYGGRGITVCERWLTFENFFVDMGERPSPQLSIDRIDNDGNYEPANCRWATRKEQGVNKRNCGIDVCGVKRTQAECAAVIGITPQAVSARIKRGWPVERAITAAHAYKKDIVAGGKSP